MKASSVGSAVRESANTADFLFILMNELQAYLESA